jgi:RNase H-like domain found in reverse transcriptase
MDPAKLSSITNWPLPKKLKDLQAFLGFCNFYHRFIQDYSTIARPLFELSKKDTPFTWSSNQDSAFQTLIKAFTTVPVLGLPNPSLPFRVITNASDFALGAVLEQPDALNRWHPVAFYSKSMLPAEQNYDIHDKELLAIIRALEYFHHYLERHPQPFKVWTNHNNLAYICTKQKISR